MTYRVTGCSFEPKPSAFGGTAGEFTLDVVVTNHTSDLVTWDARGYVFKHGVGVTDHDLRSSALAPGGTQTLELDDPAWYASGESAPSVDEVTCQVLDASYHDLTTGAFNLPSVNGETTDE
ncbi:hypothetical protein ABT255_57580 [Streptomyces mirabilis]|uniref:hypothetical protein n=1 Tax=Streptomyces mirabilis TaxID=68239 RepID=UPI0033333189